MMAADNVDTQVDNVDTHEEETEAGTTAVEVQSGFSWKSKVGADLSNSPTLGKFEDNEGGLKKALESHVNLEKLLGHEKVPLPKGPEDVEGRARFNKALGVPETAEGYKLSDPGIPRSMEGMTFDKKTFAEIVHKYDLTPKQAEGLWTEYSKMSVGVYQRHTEALESKLNDNRTALRAEWGDAFASKVELGEMVINKFSDDKEMGDWLMATLTKEPAGMKFLAKVGAQFAENKVGDFQFKRFSMSPDEAFAEIDKIKADEKHPYNSEKASQAEHDRAVEYVNRLYKTAMKRSQEDGQAV
jgi:hypothetical protein